MIKRIIPALLLMALLLTLTPAATLAEAGTSQLSEPGIFPLVQEKAELSVLCSDAAYLSDFNENKFTAWYEEQTNVHVTYIHVPSTSKRETTNLLIAGGEYPDIIMGAGLNTSDEINYGGQGIIIPLTELIEKNGFYIKDAFARQDGLPAGLITPDGNIYGLPNINDAFHTNYKYKAWINQHWLDALNLETPTTTEEFYNVLKAFKEQDPNGNGLADEIPMMGAYKNNTFDYDPYVFLLNSFVYFNPDTVNAGGFLEITDGNVTFVPNQEAYREGLRYVAKLISENLLDSTSLTQSEEQFKQLGTNPDAPLIGVGTTFAWWKFLAYNYETADARADFYPALAPLEGPEGVRYAPKSATPYGNTGAVITDHCANPDLAMKWLDGLYAPEVTKRSQFGIKGENWDDAPEGTLGINQEPAVWQLLKNFESEADPASVRNVFISDRYSDLRLGQMTDFSDPAALNEQEPKLYRETADKYAPYAADDKVVPSNLYFTDAENQEYARLKEQINTYARENLVAFLTGNKSIDTDWDSYTAEFDRLDLTHYLEFVQTAYDRQYNTDAQ